MPYKYSPADATSLAAIHWLSNAIENVSIELYATSPSTFPKAEKVLRACLKKLALLKIKPVGTPDDCPDGYELCGSVCKPSCAGDQGFTQSSARKAPARRKR